MVPARDLYVAKNQDFIRVATYGRGLWEIYPSASANQGALGNGDYDRNLQIDWTDLGAMSTRLGTTPATTTAPLYSWIEDVTGAGVTRRSRRSTTRTSTRSWRSLETVHEAFHIGVQPRYRRAGRRLR